MFALMMKELCDFSFLNDRIYLRNETFQNPRSCKFFFFFIVPMRKTRPQSLYRPFSYTLYIGCCQSFSVARISHKRFPFTAERITFARRFERDVLSARYWRAFNPSHLWPQSNGMKREYRLFFFLFLRHPRTTLFIRCSLSDHKDRRNKKIKTFIQK